MLLVKSLIVIFLLLLFARYYTTIINFLLNLFDEREGFVASDGVESNEVESNEVESNEVKAYEEEEYEELQYKVVSSSQEKITSDTSMISELQEKMNELMKIKEESDIINQNILHL